MTGQPASGAPIPFSGAGRENAEVMDAFAEELGTVLCGDALLNGPPVHAFEADLVRSTGRQHAVALNSATDGLCFALKALGIGPGDDVLVPAYSFTATASCVVRAGARPVFVDVAQNGTDSAPAGMDIADAARRITPRCKAIVWVALFGGYDDPAPVAAFASEHGLALIEDASQAFGASWGETPAGQLGAASVFSFDRNKPLAGPGTGGAVMTDDPDVAAKLRALRYHGVGQGDPHLIGHNSQMSSLTASILRAKLPHQARWIAARQAIGAQYDAAFQTLPLSVLRWPAGVHHVRHKYVMLTDGRDALRTHLSDQGIETAVHYAAALPRQRVFAPFAADEPGWPVAEALAAKALSLPIYPQMSADDVARVVGAVQSFFAASSALANRATPLAAE